MSILSPVDPASLIGRAPESLTFEERTALAGLFIAVEIYSTRTLPLRTIEAVGASAQDCIRQLSARGLDPRRFEFIGVSAPC